jgi:secreted trypsin-like serine protease
VRSFFVFLLLVTTSLAHPSKVEAVTYGDYVTDTSLYSEVVSIWEFDDVLQEYSPICTGTLISQVDVLTAAHCVRNSGELLVEIGATSLGDGSNRYVASKWFHPRYSDKFISNDVGILRLSAPANSTRIAKLPNPKWKPSNKTKYLLLGWGDDQNGDNGNLRLLSSYPLDIYAKKYWKSLFNAKTTISAGRYFKQEKLFGGACSGDSGGPLFIDDNSGQRTVAGITSWGSKDCESFAPSVFSSTLYAFGEIQKALKQLDAIAMPPPSNAEVTVNQISVDRFTPSFNIQTVGTRGSLLKVVCFSVNGVETSLGIRGESGIAYVIPDDGCSWVSANSISFKFLSWEIPSGTNSISVWIKDEQGYQRTVQFNLCKGSYVVELCSGFSTVQ